jgi:chromosome segregation ATPase
MGSITDLIAKRGKRANDSTSGVKESDYTNQISINNDIKKKLQERIDALREEQKGLDENSQAYMDLENRIWADSDAMIDLMSRNEDLAQQVRELRWKPFNELSDKIDDAIGDYDHLISLMNEQSFFDDFGDGYKLTIDGLSALALYGE